MLWSDRLDRLGLWSLLYVLGKKLWLWFFGIYFIKMGFFYGW